MIRFKWKSEKWFNMIFVVGLLGFYAVFSKLTCVIILIGYLNQILNINE